MQQDWANCSKDHNNKFHRNVLHNFGDEMDSYTVIHRNEHKPSTHSFCSSFNKLIIISGCCRSNSTIVSHSAAPV